MTRIAPGFHVDGVGDLHVDIPELLVHMGLPDTALSRGLLTDVVEQELRRLMPEVEILVADEES